MTAHVHGVLRMEGRRSSWVSKAWPEIDSARRRGSAVRFRGRIASPLNCSVESCAVGKCPYSARCQSGFQAARGRSTANRDKFG